MIEYAMHQVLRLPNYILSLDYLQQLWYYFLDCVHPNPPCQLSLWEETGAPGENPRLSAERWQTLFTWLRSENETDELRSEKRLVCQLRQNNLIQPAVVKNTPLLLAKEKY
jgi:transposase InsO family protein